ncbi:MAG: electron transfer flavoprotein subunit alpha/FixB family protein [Candidatus Aminicenantes bacterium]|nr:electron transfer flavoprotein subunit alpha/FixB family protein [Candidatus Aminicenantes bacterium]
MAEYKGILICGEVREGKITTITRELITTGRKLSDDLNQRLSILLIGENIQEAAKEAVFFGVDVVYTVDDIPFAESPPEQYLALVSNIFQKAAPSIVLFGQADMGRDIAPRLAARLGASICMDCVELAIDPETRSLLQSKPVYGGNAVAVWASDDVQPQIVTMRPRAAAPAEPDPSREGEILPVAVKIDESVIKSILIETVKEEVKGIRLDEAKVIVAGGGGIDGKEGFELLKELAQILGGTIGITRVPCDEGWMPAGLEIGQTGHVVNPDLYVAVGISGAPQHLAGCSGSKCLVAINKNPEAHIFEEADFGIVGDYREALPPLIEKCKALKK